MCYCGHMIKTCPICIKPYEGRKDSKTCGRDSCQKAMQRNPEIKAPSVDPALQKLNDDVVSQLRAVVKRYSDAATEELEFISTGFPELDELFGGFPRGLITEVYGQPGVGKSTLSMTAAANVASEGGKVLYFDVEAALNFEKLRDVGVNPELFDIVRELCIEDIIPPLRGALATGEYDAIFVDSIAAMSFRTEVYDPETGKYNVGRRGLLLNQAMRLIPHALRQTRTALVFINQTRDNFDPYGKKYVLPGGKALTYAASLMVELSSNKADRYGPADAPTGQKVTAMVEKSRVSLPFRKATFKLRYRSEHESPVAAE